MIDKELIMKKILVALSLSLVMSTSFAHGGYYGGYNNGWVGPAIIGGVIGYQLARPTYYTPPPQVVYVQPPPVYYQQPQQPQIPYGYHYANILDANCNCYRMVLVPN